MHWLIEMDKWHPHIVAIVCFWIFSNGIATMPSPKDNASPWYVWAFGFGHAVAGSLPRLVATLAPQYAKFVGAAASDAKQATDNPASAPAK